MYTLDTNAIIYYLQGDPNASLFLENIFQTNKPVYVSTITEVELFSFSNLENETAETIDAIMKTMAIISLDSRIARIAGYLRRRYKTKTADSVIAATALFTNTILVTRNVKDFQKISELSIVKI